MNLMICQACGEPLSTKDRFCTLCGARAGQSFPSAEPPARRDYRVAVKVPRTPQERAALVAERLGGWQYLLFCSELLLGLADTEDLYQRHCWGISTLPRTSISDAHAFERVSADLDEALGALRRLAELIDTDALQGVLGAPGDRPDSDAITRFAREWTDGYTGLLLWAAAVRARDVPALFTRTFEAVSRLLDGPIEQYRAAVDLLIARVELSLASVDAGKRIPVNIHVEFVLADEAVADVSNEMEAVMNVLGGR